MSFGPPLNLSFPFTSGLPIGNLFKGLTILASIVLRIILYSNRTSNYSFHCVPSASVREA
jgi:hypothetical protein